MSTQTMETEAERVREITRGLVPHSFDSEVEARNRDMADEAAERIMEIVHPTAPGESDIIDVLRKFSSAMDDWRIRFDAAVADDPDYPKIGGPTSADIYRRFAAEIASLCGETDARASTGEG